MFSSFTGYVFYVGLGLVMLCWDWDGKWELGKVPACHRLQFAFACVAEFGGYKLGDGWMRGEGKIERKQSLLTVVIVFTVIDASYSFLILCLRLDSTDSSHIPHYRSKKTETNATQVLVY
jgi:hypothetical protein